MPTTHASPDQQDADNNTSTPQQEKYPRVLFLNFASNLATQKIKKEKKPKRQNDYRVNGVNILNRTNVDSKTAIERIQRRRENHNHVERKRRDNINHTILQLSKVVPHAGELGHKLNKGKILQLALAHIQALQQENTALREKAESINCLPSPPLPPTPLTDTPPHFSYAAHSTDGPVMPSFLPATHPILPNPSNMSFC